MGFSNLPKTASPIPFQPSLYRLQEEGEHQTIMVPALQHQHFFHTSSQHAAGIFQWPHLWILGRQQAHEVQGEQGAGSLRIGQFFRSILPQLNTSCHKKIGPKFRNLPMGEKKNTTAEQRKSIDSLEDQFYTILLPINNLWHQNLTKKRNVAAAVCEGSSHSQFMQRLIWCFGKPAISQG